jgi:hypothetical protein
LILTDFDLYYSTVPLDKFNRGLLHGWDKMKA